MSLMPPVPTARVFILISLLYLPVLALACGSDDRQSAPPTQVPLEDMAAEQVLALARSAMSASTSYQATGELSIDAAGEQFQNGDFTVQWSSPDRLRTAFRSTDSSQPQLVMFEGVQVGKNGYFGNVTVRRPSLTLLHWEKVNDDADYTAEESALSVLDLSDAEVTGPVDWNGIQAFILTGNPVDATRLTPVDILDAESTDVVYISATDFRVLRVERTGKAKTVPQEVAPNIYPVSEPVPDTFRYTVSMTLDFEYPGEPIEIREPEHYVGLNGEQVRPTPTPTPHGFVLPPTATATRAPSPMATPTPTPTPNMAPANLLEDLHKTLAEMPAYDKMEIGDDIVIVFPPCEPNAGYIVWHVSIFYLPDGSAIINEYSDSGFNLRKFESVEAEQALTAVVEDETLISEILEKSARPQRCPAEMVEAMRAEFDAVPDYNKYVIDEDTVAFFPSCDGYPNDTYEYAFTIDHFPTGSSIGISADGQSHGRARFGTPDGNAMLEDLFNNEKDLIERLLASAPKSERCDV